MRTFRAVSVLALLVAAVACGDSSVTSPTIDQLQWAHLGGGACQGVQGVWSATGNPITGVFSGVIEGDLQGATNTLASIVPPGFTGRVAHGAGTHTFNLDDGSVLGLESKWVIANGRLNASYTIVSGGHGSIRGHGLFNPADLVLRYNGSVCR